ncbi:MAG: periplasmic heavy metal sensor [Acidobacteria bacterium]|nr:periplasmic heavy metal sensor [Acidobacteriota bacterium]
MTARARVHGAAIAGAMVAVCVVSGAAFAQGRGGRGGGSGGGAAVDLRSRMEILSDTFALEKDQKKEMKATLDAAYAQAAPIRAGLKAARAALFAAVQAGQAAAIDKAVGDYAAQAAAMADLEMKTLAHVLTPLTADQRKNGTMPAYYLMRGIFLDDKKWDEVPKIREY